VIRIPEPINDMLSFRWFCEFIVDNSASFRTASAIAKASLILGAGLDAVGCLVAIPESGLKLLRAALTDDEQPLQLPTLTNTETQQPISPRIWARFVDAILAKLDRLTGLAETTANQVIRLDQNVLVLAGRADAIEAEVTGTKPAITQLQRAVVEVGRDVQDIRQRLFEEAERVDRKFRQLELPNGKANGHG
jgi:hypothetical protein